MAQLSITVDIIIAGKAILTEAGNDVQREEHVISANVIRQPESPPAGVLVRHVDHCKRHLEVWGYTADRQKAVDLETANINYWKENIYLWKDRAPTTLWQSVSGHLVNNLYYY